MKALYISTFLLGLTFHLFLKQAGSYNYVNSQIVFTDDYLVDIQLKHVQMKSILDYTVNFQELKPDQRFDIFESGTNRCFDNRSNIQYQYMPF